MAYALSEKSIVLTSDLDFGAILAATKGVAPNVVQVRAEDLSPSAIGNQVISALRQAEPQFDEGVLVTVEPARMRLTLLPIRSSG